ncbi:MFS transporter [Nocardiopsis sp. N85]|uniref:MFS transporter n=1 Tax=Nocardiopsis sp. N85 TaxID=3029400 RepID=UPI00237F77CF|nr:MFS transporter [Nocardiopsis sp. N85]MDE3720377.1 MFS transporter [Nocardiopsis sp. N85]
MPPAVPLLALGLFAMVTSEFLVGGLMPQMAEDLETTVTRIGHLITAFAVAMSLGGPVSALAVVRLRADRALLVLFGVFFAGNTLAALADSYATMMAARIITGAASGGFFGVAVSTASRLVPPHMRGRAIGVTLQGVMVGTLLGLPLSTFLGGQFGWRAAFAAVGVLTLLVAVVTALYLPRLEPAGPGTGRGDGAGLREPRLWARMATSTLIIGATFSAFSYFTPILTEVTGFSREVVPLLLLGYGAATVVGTTVVGRLAASRAISVIVVGLALNTMFLTCFALFADLPLPVLVAMAGIGLVGITLNPAMATRVQRMGGTGTMVNTVHTSFITLGVVVGSWAGGVGIEAFGLRAPLWIGVALALAALLAMTPAVLAARRSPALRRSDGAVPPDRGDGAVPAPGAPTARRAAPGGNAPELTREA